MSELRDVSSSYPGSHLTRHFWLNFVSPPSHSSPFSTAGGTPQSKALPESSICLSAASASLYTCSASTTSSFTFCRIVSMSVEVSTSSPRLSASLNRAAAASFTLSALVSICPWNLIACSCEWISSCSFEASLPPVPSLAVLAVGSAALASAIFASASLLLSSTHSSTFPISPWASRSSLSAFWRLAESWPRATPMLMEILVLFTAWWQSLAACRDGIAGGFLAESWPLYRSESTHGGRSFSQDCALALTSSLQQWSANLPVTSWNKPAFEQSSWVSQVPHSLGQQARRSELTTPFLQKGSGKVPSCAACALWFAPACEPLRRRKPATTEASSGAAARNFIAGDGGCAQPLPVP
mmetsp:Transcript_115087/g.371959  ORF Transcript_115087/g.371959 Transcript_115087/m.371959 type:complete len:354 (-) Transcript_115087:11-1072(-)